MRPDECLAQIDGTLVVEGLLAPLRIVRDRWGIPHIRASSARDAFFGEGFCIGQDRLFQLELRRQMAHGTAAGFLDRGLLGRDRQNRRLGHLRYAEREWGGAVRRGAHDPSGLRRRDQRRDGRTGPLRVPAAGPRDGALVGRRFARGKQDGLKRGAVGDEAPSREGRGEPRRRRRECARPGRGTGCRSDHTVGRAMDRGDPPLRRRRRGGGGRPRRCRIGGRRLQLLGDPRLAHGHRRADRLRRPAPGPWHPRAMVRRTHGVPRVYGRGAVQPELPGADLLRAQHARRVDHDARQRRPLGPLPRADPPRAGRTPGGPLPGALGAPDPPRRNFRRA